MRKLILFPNLAGKLLNTLTWKMRLQSFKWFEIGYIENGVFDIIISPHYMIFISLYNMKINDVIRSIGCLELTLYFCF
jgi:hypothetical protein